MLSSKDIPQSAWIQALPPLGIQESIAMETVDTLTVSHVATNTCFDTNYQQTAAIEWQ
jgi:hypothetical protein